MGTCLYVRHDGALSQRVEVPPEELSIHLGSYLLSRTDEGMLFDLLARSGTLEFKKVSAAVG
jgi:hypothetical protein